MNLRFALSALGLLLLALAVAAGIGVFAVAMLNRPQPDWVYSARIADLREGEPVRVLADDGSPAFVVRAHGDLVAFDGRAPTATRCLLAWQADKRYFVDDGCGGVHYDVTGRYIDGPSLRDLDRHPVHIKDGWLVVDTRTTISGRALWPNDVP